MNEINIYRLGELTKYIAAYKVRLIEQTTLHEKRAELECQLLSIQERLRNNEQDIQNINADCAKMYRNISSRLQMDFFGHIKG